MSDESLLKPSPWYMMCIYNVGLFCISHMFRCYWLLARWSIFWFLLNRRIWTLMYFVRSMFSIFCIHAIAERGIHNFWLSRFPDECPLNPPSSGKKNYAYFISFSSLGSALLYLITLLWKCAHQFNTSCNYIEIQSTRSFFFFFDLNSILLQLRIDTNSIHTSTLFQSFRERMWNENGFVSEE